MKELKVIHDKQYKYAFFDIFDTIVSRSIHPEYTKKLWAKQFVETLKIDMTYIELYTKRNKLESELGNLNHQNGNDYEFVYSELLKDLYQEIQPKKMSYKEFERIAIELEVAIESSVQSVDEDIIKEIKKLRKEGKKVYCISDMYLSKDMIKQIFTNHNIISLFDDIFVSCEYLKNKKSGDLFDLVLKKLKAKPEECTMVGDNHHSDFTMPESKGLKAVHLDRKSNFDFYEEYMNEFNENTVVSEFNRLKKTPTDQFEHTIFSLYLFIEKLYFHLLKNNKKEVFFLSREGEYLKKLFDLYVESIHGIKIKSHYLLVSRKATYLPSLKQLKDEDFSVLLKQYSYISIHEFLKSLNFEDKEIKKIEDLYIKETKEAVKGLKFTKKQKEKNEYLHSLDTHERIGHFAKTNLFKRLLKNKEFVKIYELNRKEQNKLFKQYIKSLTKETDITVVDVGWNGSIQDNISNILGEKYNVDGCLFGLVKNPMKEMTNGNKKTGVIFYNYPKDSLNHDLYFENRALYEILLGASHGSANKYKEKNKKIEVLLFANKEEEEIFNQVIKPVQDRMYILYQELIQILCNGYYDNKKIEKGINQVHFNMIFKPNKARLTFFNKLHHYENFGVFETTEFDHTKKMTLKYYIKENIKYFIRHEEFFWDAYWPVLKLSTTKLYFQRMLYVREKRRKLKRNNII